MSHVAQHGAGVRELGLSEAAPAQELGHREAWANGSPLPFALSWRGSSVTLWVAGDRGSFEHHLFDPNSAVKGALWRLSAARPSLSEHVAFPCLLTQAQPHCWDGLQGRGRADTTCRLFPPLLICVLCFPDALWGKGEEIFISPISMRITRILKYRLEVL